MRQREGSSTERRQTKRGGSSREGSGIFGTFVIDVVNGVVFLCDAGD